MPALPIVPFTHRTTVLPVRRRPTNKPLGRPRYSRAVYRCTSLLPRPGHIADAPASESISHPAYNNYNVRVEGQEKSGEK